jgi:alkylhydroperoxidase family enzyme
MDIGSAVGRASGVAPEKQERQHEWKTSPLFDELEQLALELADGMSTTPAQVSDDLFARLREKLDEQQLVELVAAIAWENYRARFNLAFDVQPEGFSEGAVCAIPAREAPAAQRAREAPAAHGIIAG